MKRAIGKCIHGEIDIRSLFDHAHVRLGHVRIDLHFREVLGDRKNHRRIHCGGHRLADVDRPGNDCPVNRRVDLAVIEIDLGLFQIGRLDHDRGLRLVQGRQSRVKVGLGGGMLSYQFLLAIGGQLREFQCRLGVREIAVALMHNRRIRRRIDLRDNLPGLHLGVKIGVELEDVAGNLAAHLDVDHRIKRSRGGHDLGDISAGDGSSLILHGVGVPCV